MELLEAADVARGNGNWMSGGQYEGPGCSMRSFVSPVCVPGREPLTNENPDDEEPLSDCGVDSFPFAVLTSIKSRARDTFTNFKSWVSEALDAETEKAAGRFLFGGSTAIPDEDRVAWLGSDDVRTVAAGANATASVLAAVTEFRRYATGVRDEDTLLHLGLGVHWEVNPFIIDDGDRLEGTQIRVVTSPGYPSDSIAVTGPITLRLSTDQVLEEVNSSRNDRETEATRFVSLEFDPCHAVRVA